MYVVITDKDSLSISTTHSPCHVIYPYPIFQIPYPAFTTLFSDIVYVEHALVKFTKNKITPVRDQLGRIAMTNVKDYEMSCDFSNNGVYSRITLWT